MGSLTWLDILSSLAVVRIFWPVVDTVEAHQTKELSIYEDKSNGFSVTEIYVLI